MKNPTGLIAFDCDGVLLDVELGGFKYLIKKIGKEEQMLKINQEYQKTRLQKPFGLEELSTLLKGEAETNLRQIAKELCEHRLMPKTKETISALNQKYYKLGIFSSNPLLVLEELNNYLGKPFDYLFANIIEFKKGKCTGILLEKVDRYVKAQKLKQTIEKLNLTKEQVYIIGDSITDIPMSEHGKLIAFNAKDQEVLNKAQGRIITIKDLREILKFIA